MLTNIGLSQEMETKSNLANTIGGAIAKAIVEQEFEALKTLLLYIEKAIDEDDKGYANALNQAHEILANH